MNAKKLKNIEIELKLFNELQKNNEQSQRSISKELNVALGLANSLIKRFVRKGFLKLSEAPMKRYIYYLTPKGLIEKAKLTSEYLQSSLEFYNKIRNEYVKVFKNIKITKPDMILLIGISEFTEIAILAAKVSEVEIHSIIQTNYSKSSFCGITVEKNIKKFINSNKNIFFVISSRVCVEETIKTLKFNKNMIKPKFLLLD